MLRDDDWMQRALLLAERGRGNVHPNPMVGAVIVRRGRMVGEGFHHAYGQAHAEAEAIQRAETRARGGTLYINLEPCAHWGKTPPCVEAVARAGIRRVVAAMKDPNPLVSGKGFSWLKRHGISVRVGVKENEARILNRAFVTRIQKNRPYVTLKVASSLDGKSATRTGESKWITSPESRRDGWRLRTEVDAIAVGANTVLRDNPSLTAHGVGRNPVRIVFAGRRPIPRRSKVFGNDGRLWIVKEARGTLLFRKALKDLAKYGVTHLLVEGGRTLQQSFLEAGVVDEIVWFIAPLIIGNAKHLRHAYRLNNWKIQKFGKDVRVTACLPESSKR
jgi:diaminohydroxyphosphoribosylaminopyrimidine deaminase/5-amino-6-(5-phosphoribosylamino)uracil reductase